MFLRNFNIIIVRGKRKPEKEDGRMPLIIRFVIVCFIGLSC